MSEHIVLVRRGSSWVVTLLDADDDTHAVLDALHRNDRESEITEIRVVRVDEMRDGKPIHPDAYVMSDERLVEVRELVRDPAASRYRLTAAVEDLLAERDGRG